MFGRLEEGGRSSEQGLSFSDQFTTKIDIVKDMLWVNGIFAYNYSKNRNRWHYLPVAYYDGPGPRTILQKRRDKRHYNN